MIQYKIAVGGEVERVAQFNNNKQFITLNLFNTG